MSSDPNAFKSFEHAGWERAARGYHDAWGALTAQSIEPLLDAVGAGAGVRVLDLASGPGYVATAAARRGAAAVGVDFAGTMVELARALSPQVEFRQGDAEALPFPDGTFDAVVNAFGMLHLARPDQALAEAFRVLRSGGRHAFTVWALPEQAVGFRIVLDAVRSAGDPDVPLPAGPPFFRFSDPAECERSLRAVGFVDARVTIVPQTWVFGSAEGLFDAFASGTVRTGGLIAAQTEDARRAIRKAVAEAAGAHRRDDAWVFPMPAVLARAVKP